MAGVACSLVRVGPRRGAQPLEAAALQAAARLLQASRSLRRVRQAAGAAWRHSGARLRAWEEAGVEAGGETGAEAEAEAEVEAEVEARAGREAEVGAGAEAGADVVQLSVVCSDAQRGLLDLLTERLGSSVK